MAPLSYLPFTTSPADIYTSTTFEAPAFPTEVQIKLQLKYAIWVPTDQAPGTYSGTIRYKVIKVSDSSAIVERTCPITIQVNPVFQLSIDRGAIDFEKMSKGETKENIPVEGIIIASKTNAGNPWYLKISNDNPFSSGPYVIPNSNFLWYGWTDGHGTWYGTGLDQMSLSPMLMYASAADEGNTLPDGVKNHLKFKLTVPKDQPGGKYITTVRLTLTE
jgi:hypothetical protein